MSSVLLHALHQKSDVALPMAYNNKVRSGGSILCSSHQTQNVHKSMEYGVRAVLNMKTHYSVPFLSMELSSHRC